MQFKEIRLTARYLHPSVSTDAWLKSTVQTVDAMFSHFFLSDYSQTAEFHGNVLSFSWLVHQYQEDLQGLMNALQLNLSSYFAGQFSDVDVVVEQVSVPDSINKQAISVYMTLTDQDGVSHNLARVIKHDGLKVNEIIAVINADQ